MSLADPSFADFERHPIGTDSRIKCALHFRAIKVTTHKTATVPMGLGLRNLNLTITY